MEALKQQEFEEKQSGEEKKAECYWCEVWRYKIVRPYRVCPSRITKAFGIFPKCIFCNMRGSQVEGLRTRLGWSKREMARRLEIPWKTYQEISTFRRSGRRSDLYPKIQKLIDGVIESPGKYITQKMIQELTTSPLDFFNKYIGRFPWEGKNRWPSPIWPDDTQKRAKNGVGAKWPKVPTI